MLFVKTELAPHFLSQIDKIGRVGVQITKGFTDPLPQAHSFQPMGGVVASACLAAIPLIILFYMLAVRKAKGHVAAAAGLIGAFDRSR